MAETFTSEQPGSARDTANEVPVAPELCALARYVVEMHHGSHDDARRAEADVEAVRDTIAWLVNEPDARTALAAHVADSGVPLSGDALVLVTGTQDEAQAVLVGVRDGIRAYAKAVRRAHRAAKRGTPEERRIARLSEEVKEAKRGRAMAEGRATAFATQNARLTAQMAELSEALSEEQERARAQEQAARSARAALSAPRVLARHLRVALAGTPALLTAASVVVPNLDDDHFHELMTTVLAELADPKAGRELAEARALSVSMLGGGVEVGGSCVLVTAGDSRILVDVGTRPNAASVEQMPPPGLAGALESGPVDAIVLTHAHADHVGWVPAVIAKHPDVPVYATDATADLLATMWTDAAKIFSRTAGSGPVPYTQQDVLAALGVVEQIPFGQPWQVGDLKVELFPAGHVLGAAGVWLGDGKASLIVSGDVSGPGQLSVGGWDLPDHIHEPDLLVLESTYGAERDHDSRMTVEAQFLRDVELTFSAGGRVLVPAFALGRAQEIAMLIAANLPNVPVLVDGMARDVTDVFQRHSGVTGSAMEIWSDQVRPVARGRTSQVSDTFKAGVIITTSGMMTAGPALAWARKVLPDERSLVAVVGYQDPNSPGGKLLAMDETGGTWNLPDLNGGAPTPVEVSARVRKYGLGAHASARELVAIATQVRAKATMLVHGDPSARQELTARLTSRHLDVVDPGCTWRASTAKG
ncbi:MBL fold metallo-hydrolase [Myceligenerans crystallogenes]|uniref:RNA processing exonuclease, beta-lactamase fold, Cft2 family n=1 Tax=Myceligenerans crystallogenes TaxID=316335 RepID=A0ABN2NLY1_9MICO